MSENTEPNSIKTRSTTTKRKVKGRTSEYSLGQIIDLITETEWQILTDIYFCRCMPQSTLVATYFSDESNNPNSDAKTNESSNMKNAIAKARRIIRKLKERGIIEVSNLISDPVASSTKKGRLQISGEGWYFLTKTGLRIIEDKRGILEDNRLSKNELDMERAKKDHIWEIAKVYLDLKYTILSTNGLVQFIDWDWYTSLAVKSDNETNLVRPDAVLRIGEQLFYVEVDRSTEPIQRSPFHSEQVSIVTKLQRYANVIKLSTNPIIRRGIIAFIVPDAKYKTRLENIGQAAVSVFGENHRVFTGKNISEIISRYTSLTESRRK